MIGKEVGVSDGGGCDEGEGQTLEEGDVVKDGEAVARAAVEADNLAASWTTNDSSGSKVIEYPRRLRARVERRLREMPGA